MRKEVSDWLKQARYDLEDARKNLQASSFNVAAFLSQQSAEKALKALFMSQKGVMHEKSHSLIDLGRKVGALELLSDLMELNPHYVQARYPDAANEVPRDAYNEVIAGKCISIAEKVLKWVEERI